MKELNKTMLRETYSKALSILEKCALEVK